jgi:hypothetical protein
MEIAIKLQYQPPVCYFCNFQINSRDEAAIITIGDEKYFLHNDGFCMDQGIELIAIVRHENGGALYNARTLKKMRERVAKFDS